MPSFPARSGSAVAASRMAATEVIDRGSVVVVMIEAGAIAGGDLASVTAVIAGVLAADGTERWCNLTFEVDEDAGPGTGDSALFSFLAARGPSSPLATIMSAGVGPIEAGIQHRAGVKAMLQLSEAGVERCDDWVVRQDHPRRGLVVLVPEGTGADAIARWVVESMDALNRAPTTGRITYEVFEAS